MAKKDEKISEEVQNATELDSEVKLEEEVEVEETAVSNDSDVTDESLDIAKTDDTVLQVDEDESDKPITVKPVQFGSFEDLSQTQGEINKNLDILMDIKLQLTVELGRTELPIKKVLELTRGSIIELEKIAGEPVELYANGKLVAHGEVVVIEDNFGLRITSITDPEDRLTGIA